MLADGIDSDSSCRVCCSSDCKRRSGDASGLEHHNAAGFGGQGVANYILVDPAMNE